MRLAWRASVAGEARIAAARLVFVDEMGSNTALSPLFAWARPSERAHARAPRNRGENTTLLASMSVRGWTRAWRSWGAPRRQSSRRTSSRCSRPPSLSPGHVVEIDNLSAHKDERVRELVEARGCELAFFGVPSGPQPHRRGVLEDHGPAAGGQGEDARSPHRGAGDGAGRGDSQDARGSSRHCGYRRVGQPL